MHLTAAISGASMRTVGIII
jgi:hypothetical protein